jgi:hypothetical protein
MRTRLLNGTQELAKVFREWCGKAEDKVVTESEQARSSTFEPVGLFVLRAGRAV